jgi:hypothetical protein
LPASSPKVLTPKLASAIDPVTDAAGAARSEPISMQDVKPSSLCRAESDHQRETAQISANPSSAFDGDGEPRLFKCCAKSCPGLPYRASEMAHPCREVAGERAERNRLSGVETVRRELVASEPFDAVRLLVSAERSYTVHSTTLAAHFKSSDPVPWLELSAPTVRAWVAVAREAARS